MTNRRDYRYVRGKNRPRQPFMIECRQVFKRPTTPSDNDHVNVASVVEIANASTDFKRCHVTLDLRRKNQHTGSVVPTPQDIEDVAQSGRLGRRHNPYSVRQAGNGFLTSTVEEPL